MPRLGDVNPDTEPYRSEFERDRIEVFDLTALKSPGDNAHSRAFQEVTSVTAMIKERLIEGQQIAERNNNLATGE
jgi:esterase/lipase superfamily enzyme